MKAFFKKVSAVLKLVFGYGILLCLFVGSLTFAGYLIALCIGGDTAVEICHIIYKVLFPWIIRITTLLVLLGLVAMYLSGETALTAGKKKD